MTTPLILPNIAFFDSGQGGLTIWENVIKTFPNLNTQYMGDNARCPYGNKSNEIICQYAKEAFSYLENRNAILIVVACGTVSAVAVQKLQKQYQVPIIGIVESFCNYVSKIISNLNQSVAVIATRYTIKSKRFVEELNLNGIHNVWTKACPLFVPLIEEGIATGSMVDSACEMYLCDIPSDVNVVMLACTHYPRIVLPIADYLHKQLNRSVILKTMHGDWLLKLGEDNQNPIYLVDASISIIQYIDSFLKNLSTQPPLLYQEKHHVLCTDSPEQFEYAARFFTQIPLKDVEAVSIIS